MSLHFFFYYVGISIIYKRPDEITPSLFSFLEPFDGKLWGAIIAAVLGTTLVMHFVARFVSIILQFKLPIVLYSQVLFT